MIGLTHPVTDISPPKKTAPKEIPVVKPVFLINYISMVACIKKRGSRDSHALTYSRPTYKPRCRFVVNSRIKTSAKTVVPPAPNPVMTRPKMKTSNEWACDVIKLPAAKSVDATSTIERGENMEASFPTRGVDEDVATRNDVVNHIAFSYASKSAAMVDWAMVMPDMLLAIHKRELTSFH